MLLMLQTINHLEPSFLPELTLKGFFATIVFRQKNTTIFGLLIVIYILLTSVASSPYNLQKYIWQK